ncbi:putative quinol monooxygenase [Flavobacterium taihuense]|uniref:Antibiotic biosynthesis monooxygenase n=1 Tax=Flavobacterium taihuense TaxID=2857508 RepID=A0ABS6XY85_9FLAO|nr:putative quinol monooxygenase [Flavobacterium taihuense]MBW4361646.1 antibiotic biosynthesis monooxygenase [Flavobacterium taihuense]
MKINLTVIIKSKSEYREELKAILVDLTKNSKKEAACFQYDLHQNIEDPNVFILHEVWKNKEGLDLHKEELYFLKFNQVSELFLEEKITVFETSRIR